MRPTGVDDWLRTELRLAERQGLMQGLHLSTIQVRGLEILHFLDEIEKVKAKAERFKLALITTGNYDPKSLFPEYAMMFKDDPDQKTVVTKEVPIEDTQSYSEDAVWDYSEVEWKSGSDAIDEFNALMEKVGSLKNGKLNGGQVLSFPTQGQWR